MANTSAHHAPKSPGRDISAEEQFQTHMNTYRGFLRLLKWVIIATFIVLIFLYIVVQPHIQPPPTS